MEGTLFALGRIVAMPGALKTASQELIIACIRRHPNPVVEALDNAHLLCPGVGINGSRPKNFCPPAATRREGKRYTEAGNT